MRTLISGNHYPLPSPSLGEWSAEQRLVRIAGDLVKWQVHLLDQKIAAAEEVLKRGAYQEASDLLVAVSITRLACPASATSLDRRLFGLGAVEKPRLARPGACGVSTLPSLCRAP